MESLPTAQLKHEVVNTDDEEMVDDTTMKVLVEEREALQSGLAKVKTSKGHEIEVQNLEDSLRMLDCRLSVIGTQFNQHSNKEKDDEYPDLYEREVGATTTGNNAANSNLRSVDVALEGLEWAMIKGVNWVSSFLGNADTAPKEDKSGKEFEVVQTNWYGRQQTRLLRVRETELQRVHPMTGEVRFSVLLDKLVGLRISEGGSTLQVIFTEEQKEDGSKIVVTDVYKSLYVQEIVKCILSYIKTLRVETIN